MAKEADEGRRYPSELQERFLIRMPEGMRDWLRAEADRNNRSMNAEIVARLESTMSVTQLTRENVLYQAEAVGELARRLDEIKADVSHILKSIEGVKADLKADE